MTDTTRTQGTIDFTEMYSTHDAFRRDLERLVAAAKAGPADAYEVRAGWDNFKLVTHRPGEEPDPRESAMFVIPKPLTEASHLFRQETDQYYFHVAATYGATTRQNWRATDLDVDDDGVTVTGHTGETFRARYLIDASGFRSPLAEKFDLREKPARSKHHSRSLLTHYVGVKPFDDVSHHPPKPAPAGVLARRHAAPRVRAGLVLDHPLQHLQALHQPRGQRRPDHRPAHVPQAQGHHARGGVPALPRPLSGGEAPVRRGQRVREWVSTDRLQYSSKRTLGPCWCLMSHAAGFIDPLFSRGPSNTFEVVYALTTRPSRALKDNDFSEERFAYVERLERGLLQYDDDLVTTIAHLDPPTPMPARFKEKAGPIVLVNTFFVPRDSIDEFLRLWKEDAAFMKAQPGFSQLLVNVGIWESTEALARAHANPAFQALSSKLPEGVIAHPHIYQKIAVEGVCVG